MSEEPSPQDSFTFLVATDNHLGYKGDDPIVGDDSFIAFEEILQIGVENDVDFILLGGDLFHETKPSSAAMHRCMALLKEHCMGDRPISFEYVSDPQENFEHTTQNVVNYEDPNLNVGLPVFSIHGNHDDPTGKEMICALDILSCSGLVNYFGKCVDLSDKIPVHPILLRKGETLLALYGLSHIKDARLFRKFEDGKVEFFQPEEQPDDWFNILVLHQNRAHRGLKEYIPEDALPSLLDLVIWGHEHDCRIKPEFNGRFHVMQPGSSVPTSLSEGEAIAKKVAIVKVFKKEYKYTPIQLKTVRPFIFKDLCASECDLDDNSLLSRGEQLQDLAEEKVNKMIEKANRKLTGHPKQPILPLIRLRFLYQHETEMFNRVRFGEKFEDRVANPSEILLLKKQSVEKKEKRDVIDTEAMRNILPQAADKWDKRVEDYVKDYFRDQEIKEDDRYCMKVLTAAALNEAVTNIVDKANNTALLEIVRYQTERMENHLRTKDITDEDSIINEITNFNMQRREAGDGETKEIQTQLERTNQTTKGKGSKTVANGSSRDNGRAATVDLDDDEDDNDACDNTIDDSDDNDEDPFAVSAGSRGRGRGRGTRGARTSRAAKAPRATRGSRAAASGVASSTTTRARGKGRQAVQQTLQSAFGNTSQISMVRASGRSTANQSRLQFVDSDDE